MRVHYLQHVPFEGLGTIADWARERGHSIQGTALFQGQPIPAVTEFDWLVVLGGPMGVHDQVRFPWLLAEQREIERAMGAGKPVLGVCLGAELLAHVLGARVYPNRYPEIGWFPVRAGPDASTSPLWRNLPDEFVAFHWHGDAFELPQGAKHLALSDASPVQAFSQGLALGMLFHLEVDFETASRMLRHGAHEIGIGPYEQRPENILGNIERFEGARTMLWRLLDNLAAQPA